MDSNRRTALAAGALLILATVANLLATALERAGSTATGGLLELVAAGASAGVALSLYPVLAPWGPGLTLGSVVFRAIEAVMYTVAAVCLLAQLGVEQQAIGAGLRAIRQDSTLAGVLAFTVGAFLYYCVFFRSRLVPRWLSGWGLIGVLLMLAACLAALFTRHPVTSYTALILPIAAQEMVLAIWLLARGLHSPASPHIASNATLSGLG